MSCHSIVAEPQDYRRRLVVQYPLDTDTSQKVVALLGFGFAISLHLGSQPSMQPLIIRIALRLFENVTLHTAARSFSALVPLLPMHPGIAVSPKLQAEHDAQTARVYACTEFRNVIAHLQVQQGLPNTLQVSPQSLFATASPGFMFRILPDEVVLPALLASANACVRETAITCL